MFVASEAEMAAQSAQSLEARVADLCGVLNAVMAELVSAIAQALETGAWQGAGIRSPEHWVAWKCGLSRSRARALVHMAKRLSELPVTKEAFDEGRLSEDQVKVVCQHTPVPNDAEVAEFASYATVSQLSRTLGSYPFAGDKPKAEERREVSFGHREEGSWSLRAELPADEGALVETALRAERDLLFKEADGTQVSWADALVGLARRYLDPGDGHAPERYQVIIHLKGDSQDSNAHLHLGPSISPELRRLLSCDASTRYVLEEQGTPVSFGRLRRTVPSALRTMVEERDRGCRVYGCSQRRWLQVHHLLHFEDGGLTELANLTALCGAHHRSHHQGRLDIGGDPNKPDGLTFTDPKNGWVLDSCGRPRPPNRAPPQAAEGLGVRPGRFVHPRGEPLERKWVAFSEPPS